MLENFQKEIIILLLGMAPVSEVRGAIPVGLLVFNFSIIKTYLLAVIGNMFPVVPLLLFFKKTSDFLMHKSETFNHILTWLLERTKNKHGEHFQRWKYAPIALYIFVAIPLPMTGAWSGVLAAIVFGLPLVDSMIAISLGAATAGVIVTILTKIGIMTANSLLF